MKPVVCRGIRGATTASANTREAILEATKELLQALVAANSLDTQDIATAIFTTTTDLNAEFPAVAARQMGWEMVPLLCAHEMQVPDGLPRCIRVLLLVNTTKGQEEIRHIYLREAVNLRRRGMDDAPAR
ncbi:MAG: chorismate mutase [Dehalococcoidia bacterium]|nr:chorismate mutase [Dehalococcoidia bacterium]MDW8120597.1 chorismate mutase [Chloroflexota bacterium]